jgi:outer membrane protein assembly factor BamA
MAEIPPPLQRKLFVMTLRNRLFILSQVLLTLLVFSSASVFGVEPADTTAAKLREPYPEPKGLGSKIWAAPQFILDIPVSILQGFAKVVIDDLYVGKAIAGLGAMSGDFLNLHGFYPVIGLGSRSGLEYGLAFKTKGVYTAEDRFKIKAATSAHDYQRYKIRYITPNFIHDNLGITLLGEYRQSPWESFYGIGNETFASNEANYNPEQTHLSATGLLTLNPKWKLEFLLGFNSYNIFDGEDPDLESDIDNIAANYGLTLTNFRKTRFWSLGGKIHHDWRNNAGQPTAGGEEILSLIYNKSTEDNDELQFWRAGIDLRQYLHLFKKRTFALRVMAQSTDLIGDSPDLPFYLLSQLGGVESLRGYRKGRFIDNDLALVSAEYRYPLLEFMDAFVFLDEARVFPNFSDDFKWHDWKYSTGGGIRIWQDDQLVIRTFVAVSKEDTRYYFEFSDAF